MKIKTFPALHYYSNIKYLRICDSHRKDLRAKPAFCFEQNKKKINMFPGGKLPGEDFINSWYPIGIAIVLGLFFGLRL